MTNGTVRILASALLMIAPATLAAPANAQIAAASSTAVDPAASKFIEKLSSDAFAVLRDKSLSKAASRAKFRAMLKDNVALSDIGDRLIRRQRPTLTPAQYSAYQAALPEFVLGTYADRLYDYADATVATVRSVARGPVLTDVYTRVSRPTSAKPLDAIWQVRKLPGGKMLINNLTVSGVNLAMTQEADFGSYIQRNGFDKLVEFLKTANNKAPA